MRQHHAFGLARGAGGVDQRGQICRLDGADQRIEDRVALARRASSAPARISDKRDGALRQRGESIMMNSLELGLRAHGVELVELLARGNHGDAAAGIASSTAICSPVSVG